MGEGDAEVEAPAFMPGEDVHLLEPNALLHLRNHSVGNAAYYL